MNKRNILIILIVLLLLGIGAYLYLVSPTSDPSKDINEANEETLGGSGDVYSIDQSESLVTFKIEEVLNGKDFTVVGTTNQVGGDIKIDMENPSQSEVGTIRVNARTLKTDSGNRDNAINRAILKTEDLENEFIVFEPKELTGLPEKIETDAQYEVSVRGDLTVSGTTREVVFFGRAVVTSKGTLRASMSTVINYKDFNLLIPEVPFVASVEDEVLIEVSLSAIKS